MIEPTGYTALDLIGFTDRGTYAANVNYVKNDLVHYGGSIWRILIDNTIGITPAEGPNYTIFMGEPSNIVERIIAPLEDNPATVAYTTGRQIIYNDYLYEVIDDIAVGDTLITYEDDPTNANIKLAAPVETQVLALDGRLDRLETDVEVLDKTTVKFARKRKILIIGDSYERSTNFGSLVSEYLGHGSTSFVDTNLQKSSDDYIFICSRGGSGFTNTENGMFTGNGFLDRLTEAYTYMTADQRADLDLILIAGGVNDSSVNLGDEHISMLPTNMEAFNTYAKTHFPNAQINIFYLGRIRQLDTYEGRNPIDNLFNIYRYIENAGALGWGFITNSEYVCFQTENILSSDNLHPKPEHASLIARYIVIGLINGSVDVTWVDNAIYQFTPIESLRGQSNIPFSCKLTNGVRKIRFASSFNISKTSGSENITLNFGQSFKIGTQNGFYAVSIIEVPIPCIVWDVTGNKFEMMNGVLQFRGYDVFIVNRGTPTYGNGTITIQTIFSQYALQFMCETLLT